MSQEEYLEEIKLPMWKDPQGDLIMEKSRDYCRIYFGCWDEENSPDYADYIGEIDFKNAWSVRSLDVEFYDIHPKGDYKFKSSIFVVENSSWLIEVFAKRNKYYKDNWTKWKDINYKHYLVRGHDNYFEIIAEGYIAKKIDRTNAGQYLFLIQEDE